MLLNLFFHTSKRIVQNLFWKKDFWIFCFIKSCFFYNINIDVVSYIFGFIKKTALLYLFLKINKEGNTILHLFGLKYSKIYNFLLLVDDNCPELFMIKNNYGNTFLDRIVYTGGYKSHKDLYKILNFLSVKFPDIFFSKNNMGETIIYKRFHRRNNCKKNYPELIRNE